MQFFSSSAWEAKPEVLKPNQARTQLLQQLFDTASFRKLLKQLEKEGRAFCLCYHAAWCNFRHKLHVLQSAVAVACVTNVCLC